MAREAHGAGDELSRTLVWEDVSAVLEVVPSSEVDAGIDDDLRALRSAVGRDARLVVALSKCDELSPADVTSPPWNDEKLESIEAAEAVIARHLARWRLRATRVVPVSSLVEPAVGARAGIDLRWNLEALRDAVGGVAWEGFAGVPRRCREIAGLWKEVRADAEKYCTPHDEVLAGLDGGTSTPWTRARYVASLAVTLMDP